MVKKELAGQDALFGNEALIAQIDFSEAERTVKGIAHRIEAGDRSALLFSTESAKRIASPKQRANYFEYLEGAVENVLDSPKYKSGENGDLTPEEFKALKESGRLDEVIKSARRNSNQTLRRTIAQNWRETNLEGLRDPRGDRQSIAARVRNARKDGALAPLSFIADMKKGAYLDKLAELATRIDGVLDKEDNRVYVLSDGNSFEDTLLKALSVEPTEQGAGEAAQFVYELGKLWVTNTDAEHIEWEDALEAYNAQFTERPLDPNDPNELRKR